jgi:hypothetical protein
VVRAYDFAVALAFENLLQQFEQPRLADDWFGHTMGGQ